MPHYRMLGFTTSNEVDPHQWIILDIQFHTTRFKISISLSDFRDSPIQSEAFQRYLAHLLSEKDPRDNFEESDDDAEEEDTALLHDCFDWAVKPCIADFERLSPPRPPLKDKQQLTLSYFIASATFECTLVATDEALTCQDIERVEPDQDGFSLSPTTPQPPWTTSFPSFTPSEITVLCDDDPNHHPLDSNPTQVHIGTQRLYFKESLDPDDEVAKRGVETHERIANADFGANVRTSRLYGIVRDERSRQMVGLLLYHIEEDTRLAFAVGPGTAEVMRERWARQVRETLAALHGAGITWGDAKADNVLIDVYGDAWIVEFGGGRTEGWVDSGREGTVDGDLQGLERILKFIASGGNGQRELMDGGLESEE